MEISRRPDPIITNNKIRVHRARTELHTKSEHLSGRINMEPHIGHEMSKEEERESMDDEKCAPTMAQPEPRHGVSDPSFPYDVGGTASTCERFWRPANIQIQVKQEANTDDEGSGKEMSTEVRGTGEAHKPDERLGNIAKQIEAAKMGVDVKDQQMLEFLGKAITGPAPEDLNRYDNAMDDELRKIVEWTATTDPEIIMTTREKRTKKLEEMGAAMWHDGRVQKWQEKADPAARKVIRTVNGPLLEKLAKATRYEGPGVVKSLQKGGPILGKIPAAPECEPVGGRRKSDQTLEAQDLRGQCRTRNEELLRSLKQD